MKLFHHFILTILMVILAACTQVGHLPISSQTFSTNQDDIAYDVGARGSNVYVVGRTSGALEGPGHGWDAFIRKYNPVYAWGKQSGKTGPDHADDIVVDISGNAYVVGGGYVGNVGNEKHVVLLHKYAANGNLIWTRQFGSFWISTGTDVAIDDNDNVYLASNEFQVGFVNYSYIRKLAPDGTVLRRIQIKPLTEGGPLPYPVALDVDALGNIYVLASLTSTSGTDSLDSYILRYNANGLLTHSQRITPVPSSPTEKEYSHDLKLDSLNNVLVSVSTGIVPLNGYLIKYNGNDLTQKWIRKLSPSAVNGSAYATVQSIATDATDIYITGAVTGKFPNASSSGIADVFVIKYNAHGSRLWVNQFGSTAVANAQGTHGVDAGHGIAVSDAVYVVGTTDGKLLSPIAKPTRDEDAFIAQLNKTTGAINWLDQ